jgi:DNA-binding HxlR family transcriptional regulator
MPPIRTHRQWTPLARALTATGDRWTLLIVLALAPGSARLSRLKDRLPGISTGVLEQHVQHMVALGLLSRRRFREMPPRVEIELTECGRELVPIASALARWGMRHQWSAPREREQVQADALVRQLPALLEEGADLPSGMIEAVLATNDDRVRHWFRIEHGLLVTIDEPGNEATACMEGDEVAWIAALGPARDYAGLSFKGNKQLAKRVLEALPKARVGLPLCRTPKT